jgi:hypothetical protein
MPPRVDTLKVLHPKTKPHALTECFRTVFYWGADVISSPTSEALPQDEGPEVISERGRIEQGSLPFIGQNHHAIMYKIVHQQECYSSVKVLGPDPSQDDHNEGTSIPQIAGQKQKNDFTMTMNNTGVFHNLNLSPVNQGNYGTVNQGRNFSISDNRHIFNISGSMVQEDGLSGALLGWI